ncbi:MAG TPA: GTPase domain-containing protein [Terriglobales bacterium]|nr:GTPase domain-containing protein [Terriglobales bacterium]
MAVVNYATKSLALKVVYYGPGLSGKTTNLRYIYFKLDPAYRGDLVCLETDSERTYFFDLLPIKAGMIGEFKVHFQLMTVPGQVFYEASRKSVLKGADGIVFVADSQIPLLDANLENFDGLRRNCLQQDIDLNAIPLVFQYNKRDLNYLIPVETFNNLLNPQRRPFVEAVAINGVGVFETLREISKLTVPAVREKVFGEKRREEAAPEGLSERDIVDLQEAEPSAKAAAPGEVDQVQMTKVKIGSVKDIEDELEKLSRAYGDKSK